MSRLFSRRQRLRALYIKEARAFFDTPAAYVVTAILLVVFGYLYGTPLFLQGQASLEGFVDAAPLLLLFFVPAVSMRLYSEEYKSGTIELLGTLPAEDWEVLAAKYAAALTLVGFLLSLTAAYPVVLWFLGSPDWGAVAGSYAGLGLTAAVFAAIGLWASASTRNQIVAFMLAFAACFALFLAGKLHAFLPPAAARVADFAGVDAHLENLARGVLDTRDLLYFASVIAFSLFMALRAARRAARG
ncbi:MAG TPA: ABC transporter permease subunit [Elusimicrobiota bacterium]|jgi:ABC-2 type transport system permease protein|nr:ABC transporter permease subunit [Elusimicrobiota bacterium]